MTIQTDAEYESAAAAQLATLIRHAQTRPPQPQQRVSDEQIAHEMHLEALAEERQYDREHMSDRDVDAAVSRYENSVERWRP